MATAEPWELQPYEGAGPLHFGMSRDQVIELLGQPEVVIHRGPTLIEAHGDVQPGYDRAGRLVMVQTAGSALTWHGIILTGRPVKEVGQDLADAGVQYQPDDEGGIAPALGIELYAPDDEHYWPTRVQGVLVKSHEYEAGD